MDINGIGRSGSLLQRSDVIPPLLSSYAELMRDFKTLRESFEAEGLFDPSPLHVVYRLAEVSRARKRV